MKNFAALSASLDGPAFGVGHSENTALRDARRWIPATETIDDLVVVEITNESFRRIRGGNPDAVIRV